MTPDEKALIDKQREAYILGARQHCNVGCSAHGLQKDAEAAFPYPPPPVVWREAVDVNGNRYRRNGVWEIRVKNGAAWVESPWLSDDFALALARCVTEPTVGEGEVEG